MPQRRAGTIYYTLKLLCCTTYCRQQASLAIWLICWVGYINILKVDQIPAVRHPANEPVERARNLLDQANLGRKASLSSWVRMIKF